jgi:hypothetical protein
VKRISEILGLTDRRSTSSQLGASSDVTDETLPIKVEQPVVVAFANTNPQQRREELLAQYQCLQACRRA